MESVVMDWRVWLVLAFSSLGLSFSYLVALGHEIARNGPNEGFAHARYRPRLVIMYASAAIGLIAVVILMYIVMRGPAVRNVTVPDAFGACAPDLSRVAAEDA